MKPAPRRFRAVYIGDDHVVIVFTDGSVERLVPGGYGARPVGWDVEPTATRRERAA